MARLTGGACIARPACNSVLYPNARDPNTASSSEAFEHQAGHSWSPRGGVEPPRCAPTHGRPQWRAQLERATRFADAKASTARLTKQQETMPVPVFPGTYKPPKSPGAVLRRIRRHARYLAMLDFVRNYQTFVWSMLEKFEAGNLALEDIESLHREDLLAHDQRTQC